MTTGSLPVAQRDYDQSNETMFRSDVERRLFDIERKLYALQTSVGTLALGRQDLTLVNGANNHNVAPGYATYARISGPTAAFATTGFAGGERGRLLIIRNTVAFDWTISNESASSDAANRIITSTGGDVTLTGVSVASFVYDDVSARWILIATQG